MIEESKQSFKNYSFFFLLWGWLMIIAALTEYYLISIQYHNPYIGFIILPIIGGILSAIKGKNITKDQKTFTDKIITYTWIGFTITIIVALIGIVPNNPIPIILLLAGMATFITGGISNFKGFIIGSIILWIAGFLSFNIEPKISLLIYALAMLFGYIVPAYIFKYKIK